MEKKAKEILNELMDRHYQEAIDAKKNGIPVGWVASNFPQEFIEAMELVVVYPENQTASIAAKHESMLFIEEAEKMGYSNDICGYARVSLAYTKLKTSKAQDMPMPDYVLCSNNICNQLIKWFENIAKELDIPMILFDIPFNNNYCVTKSRLKYMKDQTKFLVSELEKITGKTFKQENLDRVMKISNECGKQWRRAQKYAKLKPSPINGFIMFNYMSLMVCARGRQETVDLITKLADELESAVESGKTTFKGDEKHRILMEGIACWPHLRHNYKTLTNLGINLVGTVYTDTWGRMYKSMDEMLISYGLVLDNLNLERATKRRTDIVKDAQCNGAIFHMNKSCKIWDGFLYEMERRIHKETGVPTIMYDGDQADARCYSEAQFETRIQGLYEIMEDNKVSGIDE